MYQIRPKLATHSTYLKCARIIMRWQNILQTCRISVYTMPLRFLLSPYFPFWNFVFPFMFVIFFCCLLCFLQSFRFCLAPFLYLSLLCLFLHSFRPICFFRFLHSVDSFRLFFSVFLKLRRFFTPPHYFFFLSSLLYFFFSFCLFSSTHTQFTFVTSTRVHTHIQTHTLFFWYGMFT